MNNSDSKCENCRHYGYDEYFEVYVCDVDLDEDETEKFMTDTFKDCPYYDPDDDYKIVRHQA